MASISLTDEMHKLIQMRHNFIELTPFLFVCLNTLLDETLRPFFAHPREVCLCATTSQKNRLMGPVINYIRPILITCFLSFMSCSSCSGVTTRWTTSLPLFGLHSLWKAPFLSFLLQLFWHYNWQSCQTELLLFSWQQCTTFLVSLVCWFLCNCVFIVIT